jgi:hypothetical protein
MLLIIGATEKKENNKVWLHKMNNGTIGLILTDEDISKMVRAHYIIYIYIVFFY